MGCGSGLALLRCSPTGSGRSARSLRAGANPSPASCGAGLVNVSSPTGGERSKEEDHHQSLVPADEPRGKPGESSLRHAGEIHPLKPATDVVLMGCAYAPGGKPVPQFGAAFSVGRLRKVVAVFGDRTWKSGIFGLTPSSPVPVTRVPLVWKRAYGGRQDLGEGRFAAEMRNPPR